MQPAIHTTARGFRRATCTYVNVLTYTSDEAATADFAGAEQRRRAESGYSEIVFTAKPIALGNESWSVTMRSDASGKMFTITYVRFGDIASGIRANGTSQSVPDIVNALLASQLACMRANDGTQPTSVPPGLVEST